MTELQTRRHCVWAHASQLIEYMNEYRRLWEKIFFRFAALVERTMSGSGDLGVCPDPLSS